MLQVLLLTTLASLAIPLGAWLGRIEHLHSRWLEQEFRHAVIAFGGGILLAAVALALGAAAATNTSLAFLLALLVSLQNLPEGFNAYRELAPSKPALRKRLPLLFLLLVPLGPLCGAAGYLFLSGFPAAIGAIMLFASGGILYLVFQDIAPQAQLKRAFAPPLGAVLGFLFGLLCHQLLSSLPLLPHVAASLREVGGSTSIPPSPLPPHPQPPPFPVA